MEEGAADPLGVHRHHFGENPLITMLQMNLKSLDYKVTMKALRVGEWSTRAWVKAMLKLLILSELPSCGGYHTNDSQEIAPPNRLPEGNFRRRVTLPASSKASKQAVQVSDGRSTCMQSATTMSEAIGVLNN